jgi:hypothetical protein
MWRLGGTFYREGIFCIHMLYLIAPQTTAGYEPLQRRPPMIKKGRDISKIPEIQRRNRKISQ